MIRWGARLEASRRVVAVAAAGLLVVAGLGFVGTPAAGAATGGDCGGGDTPPARHLANGETCDGSLNEPAASSTPHPIGYVTHSYADAFTYDHTDGDMVQVDLNGTSCIASSPADGRFIASGDGPSSLSVTGRRTATPGGAPDGPCPTQPDAYQVRVMVVPNDRPTVTPGSVDTSGQPGDLYTFHVSGTDPDGNLTALGVRFGDSDNYDWKSQVLSSGSWSTSFEYRFYSDVSVRFYSRDSYGALSPPSASFTIDVGQNDCGLGRDAAVEAVTLPLHCGNNWLDGAADVDSFTFTPSPGMRPKATVTAGVLQGYVLTLTSPSGVVRSTSDQGDPDLYGTTEEGQWRVDVRGDGDVMGYILDIVQVAPAAAPVLTIDAPGVAHQGDWFAFVMTAHDPNGETLTYQVDWGNGSRSSWPIDGRAASGVPVTGYRRFIEPAPLSWTATVTVTNTSGLTDVETFTVSVRLHDDCGFGTPSYDAPGTPTDLRVMPSTCDGTAGYGQAVYYDETDSADWYRSPVSCLLTELCKVRVTMTTDPGLAATVTIDDYLSQPSSSCGPGGCTTVVESVGPTYPSSQFPRISVVADSGKGAYRLVVEKVPLTHDVL